MKYIFLLSGDYKELAKEEVLSLFNIKKSLMKNNLLFIDLNSNENLIIGLSKRLALTKKIYRVLFECKIDDLIELMKKYDWNSVYKGSFSIRAHYIDNNKNAMKKLNKKITMNKTKNKKSNSYSEKSLAKYVWRSVKNPKVDLDNPDTQIDLFFIKNRVLCCLLIKKIENDFDERKSHLRPKPSPVSLHPKLARAMVNLTGAGKNDIILDPFCGSGGILLEAGLMGFKAIGYDINKKMVWKSMVNLKHYKIKGYELKIKDFFKINKKYDYIITDLPYGLNTNIMQKIRITKNNKKEMKDYLNQFYSKVTKKLEKLLIKKAIIIFPSYINYKKLLKKSKLKIKNEFSSYVHSSLTRKIVVLER